MPEHENATLMRLIAVRLARGEQASIAERFRRDVTWEAAPGGTARGRDQVLRALCGVFERTGGIIDVLASDWGAVEIAHDRDDAVALIGFEISGGEIVRVHSSSP